MRWVMVATLTGLSMATALAQVAESDLDRARRDAEKVFSFIKFHTLKRPSPSATAQPPKGEARAAPRRSAPERATVPPPKPEDGPPPVAAVIAVAVTEEARTMEPVSVVAPGVQASSAGSPSESAQDAVRQAGGGEPAMPSDDEGEPAALRLQDFVAPEFSPALLASLGPTPPRVRLRFSVEADGRVSSASAREGTPRRLAAVAERALLQWRFEPLSSAQDAEVELVLKSD